MDETVKYQSNFHKCEECGRRTAKQRAGKWICRACYTGEGSGKSYEERRLENDEEITSRDKRSSSEMLVESAKPTLGIGDSLKELEEKLDAIEEQKRLTCLQIALKEYKEFHDASSSES